MESKSREHKKLPSQELTVTAQVSQDALALRQSIAEATLQDGRTVEIGFSLMSGHVLITVTRKSKYWRTYALSPQTLVDAVLKAEESR